MKKIREIIKLLILIVVQATVNLVIKLKPAIHIVSAMLAVFVLVVDIVVGYKVFKDTSLFGQAFPQVLILSALFYVLGMLSIFTGKERDY